MAGDIPNLVTCACGLGPILVTMRVAAGQGADSIAILRYATSADAGGDPDRVVGYGAVMFWRYRPPDLSGEQKAELLTLARESIAAHLAGGALPAFEPDDAALMRRSRLFITLTKDGELRGCVGHTAGNLPLYQAVQRMAVAAASQDPRFPALAADELSQVAIEISILSPRQRVTEPTEVQVGTHGLFVADRGRSGLLLPQVALQEGWDQETFLNAGCQKAGRPSDCWRHGAHLYTFTAVVFGEE
jgi:AmmeMemoRadiSam system protein A